MADNPPRNHNPTTGAQTIRNSTYIYKSRASQILLKLSSPFLLLLQIVRVVPAIALGFFSEQCIRGKGALVPMDARRRNDPSLISNVS